MRHAHQRGALCAHNELRNCLYQWQFVSDTRRKSCLQKNFDEVAHERSARSTAGGAPPWRRQEVAARSLPADERSLPRGAFETPFPNSLSLAFARQLPQRGRQEFPLRRPRAGGAFNPPSLQDSRCSRRKSAPSQRVWRASARTCRVPTDSRPTFPHPTLWQARSVPIRAPAGALSIVRKTRCSCVLFFHYSGNAIGRVNTTKGDTDYGLATAGIVISILWMILGLMFVILWFAL